MKKIIAVNETKIEIDRDDVNLEHVKFSVNTALTCMVQGITGGRLELPSYSPEYGVFHKVVNWKVV